MQPRQFPRPGTSTARPRPIARIRRDARAFILGAVAGALIATVAVLILVGRYEYRDEHGSILRTDRWTGAQYYAHDGRWNPY